MVTVATFKNILKLENLGNLKLLGLLFMSSVFNVADLSNFIEKYKDTKIWFEFIDNVSAEYKEQLDALIDTVIQSNVPNRIIVYDGQDEEKLEILESHIFGDDEEYDSDDSSEDEEMDEDFSVDDDEYMDADDEDIDSDEKMNDDNA
uniref:Uncharacterized protein n=1 Tax=Panagrolaimus sp. ES5 TaxID=591445 RepID=A0AC34G944_9BILA